MIYLFTGNMGTGFQLTAARRRLVALIGQKGLRYYRFQLTAARRRLVTLPKGERYGYLISTHSRAKAAGPQT